MENLSRRSRRWIALGLGTLFLAVFLAGCSEKPKPNAGGTYYEGPMKPKGGGGSGDAAAPGGK